MTLRQREKVNRPYDRPSGIRDSFDLLVDSVLTSVSWRTVCDKAIERDTTFRILHSSLQPATAKLSKTIQVDKLKHLFLHGCCGSRLLLCILERFHQPIQQNNLVKNSLSDECHYQNALYDTKNFSRSFLPIQCFGWWQPHIYQEATPRNNACLRMHIPNLNKKSSWNQ